MINAIIKKYNNIPVQVKASFWFLVCAFMQRGISFITTPIFTRLLTASEYGSYNVFNSWLSVLSVIVTMNLYSGVYTRGLVKFENDKKRFSSSLQGLTLILVVVWLAIYLVFHQYFNQLFSLTTVQMLLMILIMWTTAVYNFWAAENRVNFRYKTLVIVTIVVAIAKPVLGIFFVINAEDKVTARILGIALVELAVYTGFFFLQMFRGKTFCSLKYWKHSLSFNIPLIPHYLSSSVLNSADRIMIERMVNSTAAGIYSLAYSISVIMTVFNTAMIQTIEPWMYKKIHEKKISDISKVAYPAFVLIAMMNVFLIAFAPEIVTIFAPPEYYEAIFVIPPVAMSVFFTFSYTFFAVFEFYYEKTKLVAIATCVGAIMNVVLNYFCINWFGYIAAGYTTLICYIMYAIFHYMFMRRICNKYLNGQQPYQNKIYFSIAMSFIALGCLFMITYKIFLLRYVLILTMLAVCFVFRKKIIHLIKNIINVKQKRNG